MYTNHRHYVLLILALCAVALSIAGYVFLRNIITIQSIHAAQVAREVAFVDEAKKREQDTASIYAKTAVERERLLGSVVSKEKIVDFIQAVEKIGIDSGVSLDLTGIDYVAAGDKGPAHFRGHVEVHGSWAATMKTLLLVESMPYSLALSEVRLTQSAAVSSTDIAPKPGTTVVKGSVDSKPWTLSFNIRVLAPE